MGGRLPRPPGRSRGTDRAQGLTTRQRAAESDAKATAARSDGRARVSGRVVGVPPSARGRAGLRAAPRAFVQRREIGAAIGSQVVPLFQRAGLAHIDRQR